MTISAERERQLLASAATPADALRAIQFLLGRVRELEAEIKATDILLVALNEREDELIAACTEAEAHCSHLTTRGRLYGGEVEMRNEAIVQALRHALKGKNDEQVAR